MLNQSQIKELQHFLNEDHEDLNHVIHNSNLDPKNDFEGFDFNGLFMKGVDLSGFNLENATFNRSLLNKVDFKGSNLKNARFHVSNLRRCQFKDAHYTNTLVMERVHLFNNYDLNEKPQSIWSDFGKGLGKVLFIEDEEKSIEQNLIELKASFPGLEIEVVGNETDARSKIITEAYSLAVIDAKIPEASTSNPEFKSREELRGAEIANDLSMGNLISANQTMLHVVLTHFTGALKLTTDLPARDKYLGMIQKDNSETDFENKVIRTMFFEFLNTLVHD